MPNVIEKDEALQVYNKLQKLWDRSGGIIAEIYSLDDEEEFEKELKKEIKQRIIDWKTSIKTAKESTGNSDIEKKYLKKACNEALSDINYLLKNMGNTVGNTKDLVASATDCIGLQKKTLSDRYELGLEED